MINFKVVRTTSVLMSEEDFQAWLNSTAESVGCDSDGLDSKTAIEDYLLEEYDSLMNVIYYTDDIDFYWIDTDDNKIKSMLKKAKEHIEDTEG